jgi:drug/metabolite transporter (DMT)-like permease
MRATEPRTTTRLLGPDGAAWSLSGIAFVALLTVTWGLNWPMMKLAVQEVPPWTFRSLCVVVGGSALLAITRLAGARVTLPREKLPSLMLVALFNITGWHLFSAYALLYTGSGRAAIIGYTMPIWASVLSVLVLHERIGARRVLALALGMAGLALLLGHDLGQVGAAPTGALLMLGAASSWAIGTVLIKRFAWHPMPVMALSGWQLLIGGVPIVIGWWLWEPVPDLGALSLGSAIGLAYAVLVAMIFCQTAYFKMVTLVPANVAAMAVMAVPVVGVLTSAWILGEPVGLIEAGALVLVVGGLFLLVRRSSGQLKA